MSSAHVFAHAPRDQLEPKSVTRYGHIQSISVFTILVDWTTAHKSSPNNSILYFFLHAVTNRVVVSMGLYSCLLFKTCRTYADLGLLVYLYIYNIYTHTHTHKLLCSVSSGPYQSVLHKPMQMYDKLVCKLHFFELITCTVPHFSQVWGSICMFKGYLYKHVFEYVFYLPD